jgi:uracil-DNA glycosylase
MAVRYIFNSNILEYETQVIAHPCAYSQTKTPKGFTKEVFAKYPYANVYLDHEPHRPGSIKMKGKGKKWICAMFCQKFQGEQNSESDTFEKRMRWLQFCLDKIVKIKNLRSITFPDYVGCSFGVEQWEIYTQMIEKFADSLPNVEVSVVSYGSPISPNIITFNFIKSMYLKLKSDKTLTLTWKQLQLEKKKYDNDLLNPEEVSIDILEEETYLTTSLKDYTQNYTPKGWEEFFTHELDEDYGSIQEVSDYLAVEMHKYEIFPPLNKIYTAFNLVPLKKVKVVIIGQDVYHDLGQAMGICFSVADGIPPPPSLKNIYKELVDDGFSIKDISKGNLTKWCKQGVLMINSALTVRAHEAGSHLKKWSLFTASLMRFLNEKCGDLIVIMWGASAQNFSPFFDDRHKKITGVHPSPLSAHRGFFGSKPFSNANHFLEKMGKTPIDWSL